MNNRFRPLRWLALCLFLPLLTACLQVDVRFDVRPDGSGQITETYRVREDAPGLPKGDASPLSAFMSAPRLAERANELGPGVSASAEILGKEGGYHVARITFDVPDFNGLTWRFGNQPTNHSLSYRFELNRRTGQPTRVDIVNDPFAKRLRALQTPGSTGAGAPQWLLDSVRDMAGVKVAVGVHTQGEPLHANGTWQQGADTPLLTVDADAYMAQPDWPQRLRGTSPCGPQSDPTMRLDCQDRISIWLR